MNLNEVLIKAGTVYKKDLLTAPQLAFDEIRPYFNIRTGVQGKVVGGLLTAPGQFAPYKTNPDKTDNANIVAEEWETYLGQILEEFDPNVVLGSLYTEKTSTKITEMEIAKKVAMEIAMSAGENLVLSLFTAVRNASGTTTVQLYNGYDKLTDVAIVDEKVSEELGNLIEITDTLTRENVGDKLRAAYRKLNLKLKSNAKLKLYVPISILEMYEDWFQDEFGTAAWNEGIEQKYLIGTSRRCEFIPLASMEAGKYLYFTVTTNMNIGFDAEGDKTDVKIREVSNPNVVQLHMKSFFGVGFETVIPEFFCAVSYTVAEEGGE
jgi:hypothetical protein